MPNNDAVMIGRVVSVWRFPVKSMLGEELNSSQVAERGLLGDRAYAFIDSSNGKVASAKNPAKWSKMFECSASFTAPPIDGEKLPQVRITLPDGTSVSSDQADLNRIVSSTFGRDVELASSAPHAPSLEEYWPDIDGLANREIVTDEGIASGAPAGTFFDFSAIHFVTTATLNRLHDFYPQGRFEVRRFRPNFVIEPASGEKGFPENEWEGHTLLIGEKLRLKVIRPCARCVMTNLAQGTLPKDPGILRTIAQRNKPMIAAHGQALPSVGAYASVITGGMARVGDIVRLE